MTQLNLTPTELTALTKVLTNLTVTQMMATHREHSTPLACGLDLTEAKAVATIWDKILYIEKQLPTAES